MSTKNPWLSPYQRSYQQIKSKLIEDLKTLKDSEGNTLITDYSEGNILIIIISMFAAIAETLHYYIDNAGRESFLSTSRRYESVVKHGMLVDYHARAAIASTVDLVVTRPPGSNYNGKISIPQGSSIKDNQGNTWQVSREVVWDINVSTCKIPLIQHNYHVISDLTNSIIPAGDNVILSLGSLANVGLYEEGTLSLYLNNVKWTLVKTFAYSKPTDTHFMVVVNQEGVPNIVFGDGIFGAKPKPYSVITNINCYITQGYNGNVGIGEITELPSPISDSLSDASASNPNASAGGSNYEDFDMLKEHIPLHIRTQGVAITAQDFEDLAKTVDGVGKAKLEYECGRKLNIYISPDGGGEASTELCTRVQNYIKRFAPLTTYIKVKPAGIAQIILDISVTGKKSFKSDIIKNNILQALYDKYSPEASNIGGSIRLSDIYALIDNLPTVDYLHVNRFYVKPWPSTIVGSFSLVISEFSVVNISNTMTYYVYFTDTNTYTIRSLEGGFVKEGLNATSSQSLIDEANGNNFTIAFENYGYPAGSKYQFTVSQIKADYEDNGYNVPVFENSNQLTLHITETL